MNDERDLLRVGEVVLDRYAIVRLLGEGGMGAVYEAKQLKLGRSVAIKTLNPRLIAHRETQARFKREALVLQALTHPNTIRLYDFGETESGVYYLVMEYLKGDTLDRHSRSAEPFDHARVRRIAQQCLKSLLEAHSQGIVHRDIKPSNIMLCEQIGEQDFVKVIDFGIAFTSVPLADFRTQTGAFFGTPHFMSPEQVRGKSVDGRSDIYSLGLTLIELLTGVTPYQGATPFEVAMKHVHPDPVQMPESLAASPLGQVIAKAVVKNPKNRYQTAQQMLEDLEAINLEALVGVLSREAFAMTGLGADALPTSLSEGTLDATSASEGGLSTQVEPGEPAAGTHKQRTMLAGGGAVAPSPPKIYARGAAVAPRIDGTEAEGSQLAGYESSDSYLDTEAPTESGESTPRAESPAGLAHTKSEKSSGKPVREPPVDDHVLGATLENSIRPTLIRHAPLVGGVAALLALVLVVASFWPAGSDTAGEELEPQPASTVPAGESADNPSEVGEEQALVEQDLQDPEQQELPEARPDELSEVPAQQPEVEALLSLLGAEEEEPQHEDGERAASQAEGRTSSSSGERSSRRRPRESVVGSAPDVATSSRDSRESREPAEEETSGGGRLVPTNF